MSAAKGCHHKGCFNKMCSKCSEVEPYMEFRAGKGYFWGQGFPDVAMRGEQPHWMTSESEKKESK